MSAARRWRNGLAFLCAMSSTQALRAQNTGVLFDTRDIAVLAGATVATAALIHFDKPIARALTDTGFHSRHPSFTTAAKVASYATETVYMLTGGAVYGLARWRGNDGVADVAFHTTEGVASAALVIQVIRGALGRARPYVINDSGEVRDADPDDAKFGRGFTSYNYRSWPSMHAMASFAVASGLASEMRWRGTRNRQVASLALYAAASMPAVARSYLDEHWASDIAMGAFIGVFAGQKAVNYSHAHPGNRPDNFFLGQNGLRATITMDGSAARLSILPF